MTPGKRKYWNNACMCLAFLAPAAFRLPGTHWWVWLVSFVIGFIYADFFEYAFHRWDLHNVNHKAEARHRGHHRDPDNELTVNLGGSVWTTFALFMINGVPLYLLDLALGTHWFSGAMTAFVAFFLLTEEIHWQSHLGGRLRPLFGWHHRRHHMRPGTNFNIWLPIFDYLLGTKE